MACMKIEGIIVSREASENISFENWKALVYCLDPPQECCREIIIQQPASIRNRRLLTDRNLKDFSNMYPTLSGIFEGEVTMGNFSLQRK